MTESVRPTWKPTHRGKPRAPDRATYVDPPKFESMGKGKKQSGSSVLSNSISGAQWPATTTKSAAPQVLTLRPRHENPQKSSTTALQVVSDDGAKNAPELPSYEESKARTADGEPAVGDATQPHTNYIISLGTTAMSGTDTTPISQLNAVYHSEIVSTSDDEFMVPGSSISGGPSHAAPPSNPFGMTTELQSPEIVHEGSYFSAAYSADTSGADFDTGGYCCYFCSEKDAKIDELEADVRLADHTIELLHEEDDKFQFMISKLHSRLADAQRDVNRARNSVNTFTKQRIKKLELDLRHAEGARAKNWAVMRGQEETNMELQDVVKNQATRIRADMARKKNVKRAVQSGEMSFEEAFCHLCLDDDDDEIECDESGDEDSGVELGSEPVDAMDTK